MRKTTITELHSIVARAKQQLEAAAQQDDRPVKIYLHWSAGHYDQFFDDYHINVGSDGILYVSTEDLSEIKSHTYHRNSGAVGIAAACAYEACSTDDLGPEPPTDAQIESMAQAVAVLADELEIAIDIEHVMTHAEAADNMDGDNRWHDPYGPNSTVERWDFWVIKAGDQAGSGGDILRGKGVFYQQEFNNHKK